eukprot:TRINITY_DN8542_c0_g1_i1.p1 TRINITY_DN8542_c0_g1~~TRINITY_DN8542_c0_g1_i1.p1  ORF type:complete len:548 (-),score=90.75 TRINITY_DN8542_c0_g1_i1:116-1759(-)
MLNMFSTYEPLCVAAAVVMASINFQVIRQSGLQFCSLFKDAQSTSHVSATRVSDEMHEIRKRWLLWAVKVLMTLNWLFFSCLSIGPALFGAFARPSPTWIAQTLAVFACVSPFALDILDLTASRLNFCVLGNHGFMLFRVMLMDPSSGSFVINTGVRTVHKLVLGLVALDRRATIPSNLLSSAVIVLKFGTAGHTYLKDDSELFQFMLAELVACCFICIASSLFESVVEDRVVALCEEEDARMGVQQILQASRKMLTVLCDADVELDKEGKVIDECPKLNHLMMAGTSKATGFAGRWFHDFVQAADRKQFHDFINWKPSQEAAQAPSSLHLFLQGAAGLKFQVEMFHVPINGFRRSDRECHHLIGIRELESWEPVAHSIASSSSRHDERTVDGNRLEAAASHHGTLSSACSEWTSVSQRRPDCDRETTEDEEIPWASRLKSIELEVDAGHPDLPVRSVNISFSEHMPACTMRTHLQTEAFCALYAWLVMSVMALKCNTKPVPSLTNFALESKQFGGIVAGQVVLQTEFQESGQESWAKIRFEDISTG